MQPHEIRYGLELCRLAGWNQMENDWLRFLRLAPEGVFVAEERGAALGTATALCHGDTVGWIGMVLVYPGLRRRGIGTALLAHCIDYLHERRVESIKLDATDQGRFLYEKLGFCAEQAICRYKVDNGGMVAPTRPVRMLRQEEWQVIGAMDESVFGADRSAFLQALHKDSISLVEQETGVSGGYGFVRPGFQAFHLGPVVAFEPPIARCILTGLLSILRPGPVFWDLFPANQDAMELATELGFLPQRHLTRMVLGESNHVGQTERVYAVAGFEWG